MDNQILAIDPGTERSAWVSYDIHTKLPSQFDITDNQTLLKMLERDPEIDDIFYSVDVLAIEMIASYGMPVGKSIFETCAWIGRFEQAFGWVKCKRIYRIEVKSQLCRNSRAKDSNIRQAIIDRYPPTGGGKCPQIGTKKQPGPLYGVRSDIWAALAIAITYAEKSIK